MLAPKTCFIRNKFFFSSSSVFPLMKGYSSLAVFASVGTDRLLCVILTAVVRFGLVLKVLVHVHLVLSVHGGVRHHGARFYFHVEGALDDWDDWDGGLGAGRGTGAVWRHVRGGRSGRHCYGTRVDDTCVGGDGDLRLWLLPDRGEETDRFTLMKCQGALLLFAKLREA